MDKIFFSVVIPLYNKEKSIVNTINSVLIQTYPYFELIIVNDGSTDSSLKIVESIKDNRIRIINQKNGGVSNARNNGIKKSKYEWIAFLDGDDEWLPNFLITILHLIEKFPEAYIYNTRFSFGISNANSENNISQGNSNDRILIDYFDECINNYKIHSSSVVVKRSCFSQVGYFNENLTHGEDLEMWIRLSKNFRIATSNAVCSIYRTDAENRAVTNLPAYHNHFMSMIELNNIGKTERKYYQNLLVIFIFDYINGGNIAIPLLLIKKHKFKLLRPLIKKIFSAFLRHGANMFKNKKLC